ncbi:transglycosylase SLT domain-containing protein [Nocardioides luti]|uniref:lytic transglycosylase domain-containing protein n=1 Tax=Nocardioides luti TaxID=2761101 RepID=UPI001C896542
MIRLLLALVCATTLSGCSADDAEPRAGGDPGAGSSASSTPSPGADRPTRPSGPGAVAESLTRAEQAIADPATDDRALTAAARQQQVSYRTWSDHPGWDRRVLAAVPATLRPLVRDNLAARRSLRSIYPTSDADLPTTLPAWRIDPPDPLPALVADYRLAQRRTGVDWRLLAAINFVETDFGRITGDSEAGAQGPMQFIPATWESYGAGGDIRDPHDAILAAGRLLAANGFADDPFAALHHYNNSDGYVRAVLVLADILREHPRELRGWHEWQIYYLTHRGPVLLPEGYDADRPVPVDRWLRQHPAS